MKKLKGFTLIELLGVIVLIAGIALISYSAIVTQINKSRGEISEVNQTLIKSAAELYITENRLTYSKKEGNVYCVPIQELIDAGILSAPVLDVNGDEIDYTTSIKTTYLNGQFTYDITSSSQCKNGTSVAPSITNIGTTTTSNSITISIGAISPNSTITDYYFSLDGINYTSSTSNIKTISGLTSNTNYTVYVKVKNNDNYEATAKKENVFTSSINAPIYLVSDVGIWTTSKDVTITYPSGYSNYYQITSGTAKTTDGTALALNTWYLVDGNSTTITMTSNGTIVAKTTDGTNTITSAGQNVTMIDITSPIITSATPSGIWGTTEKITVIGEDPGANENMGSGIYLYALTTTNEVPENNSTLWQASNEFNVNNNTVWYAWIMDNVGNVSISRSVTNSHVCLGIWDLSVNTDGSIYGILKLDKTFLVTGSGATKDFANTSDRPYQSLVSKIESIVIEEGITGLGAITFQGIMTVQTVEIPSTLKNIQYSTFEGMTGFNANGITIASGNTRFKFENSTLFDYNKTTIYVHSKNDTTSAYTIPNTVTYISHGAFQNNNNITTLNVNSLFNIGWNAFNSCTNLTTINSTVGNTTINGVIGNTAISPNTFYNTKLTNAKISKTVTSFSKSGTTYFPFVTNAGTIYYYGSNAAVTEYLANKPALDIATYKAIATVSFDSNGGSSVSSIEAVYGEAYGAHATLPTSIKEGYVFQGWYTSINGGTSVTSSTIVSQGTDHTLYAHWGKDVSTSLTVTINPTSYTYDGTAKTPTVTVKDGDTTLVLDTDYSISYSNNINAGTATVTVTGKNVYNSTTKTYYNGTINKSFTINQATNTLSVASKTLTYTGSAQSLVETTGAQGTMYYSTTALTASNYTTGSTTIPTKIDAGTYTVYYYTPGNTNYALKSGNVSTTISTKSVAVTWGSTTTFTYNGSAQAPTASITTGITGETMNVTRTTGTNAGSYTSTASCSSVTGGQAKCTNYTLTGTTKAFTINLAPYANASVKITGNNFVGNNLTASVTDTTTGASYSYQWYTNTSNSTSGGTAISGATTSTLALTSDYATKYIYVNVIATKTNYEQKTLNDITDITNNMAPTTGWDISASSSSLVYAYIVNGAMSVKGSGAMKDFTADTTNGTTEAPWKNYRSSITSLVFDDTITKIGTRAFLKLNSITTVTLPSQLITLGESSFYYASSLTGTINIPSAVATIGLNPFLGAPVTKYTVASGNNYFAAVDDALYNKAVTSLISYPMGKAATSYVVPSTVTAINSYSAYNSKITDVTITSSSIAIGGSAFQYSGGITNLAINSSTVTLYGLAFANCANLATVKINATTLTLSSANQFATLKSGSTIYVGTNTLAQKFSSSNYTESRTRVYYGPADATVNEGSSVTMSISTLEKGTADALTYTYQWQRSTDSGTTWSNISGATSLSYTVSATASMNGYKYRCAITSAATLYTNANTLTVYGKPTSPTITSSDGVTTGNWHNSNITLTFGGSTVSGTGGITYYYGTSTDSMTTGTSKSISSSTSNTTYYVKACNSLSTGLCSAVTTYVVKFDTTLPSYTLSINNGGVYSKEKTATITLTDDKSGFAAGTYDFYYVWSYGNPQTCENIEASNNKDTATLTIGNNGQLTGTVSIFLSGDTGANTLYVCSASSITDRAGNTKSAEFKGVSAYLDNTAPIVSLNLDTESYKNNHTYTIKVDDLNSGLTAGTYSFNYLISTNSTDAQYACSSSNSKTITATAGATSISTTINYKPSTSGEYYFFLCSPQISDAAGNSTVSSTTGKAALYDEDSPVVSLGVNSTTASGSHVYYIGISDSLSGLKAGTYTFKYLFATAAGMQSGASSAACNQSTTKSITIDSDGANTTFVSIPYSAPSSGTHYLIVCSPAVNDVAGNSSTANSISNVSGIFNITAPSISINGGDRYTKSTGVEVTLNKGTFTPTKYYLSNSSITTCPTVSSSSYVSATIGAETVVNHTLGSANGEKTVYACFANASAVSGPYTDSIILDNTSPVMSLNGNSTPSYINKDGTVTIPLKITDSTSGPKSSSFTLSDITIKLDDTTITPTGSALTNVSSSSTSSTYKLSLSGISGTGSLKLYIGAGNFSDYAGNDNVSTTISSGAKVDNTQPYRRYLTVNPTSDVTGWYVGFTSSCDTRASEYATAPMVCTVYENCPNGSGGCSSNWPNGGNDEGDTGMTTQTQFHCFDSSGNSLTGGSRVTFDFGESHEGTAICESTDAYSRFSFRTVDGAGNIGPALTFKIFTCSNGISYSNGYATGCV